MEKWIRPVLLAVGLGALILVRCGHPEGEAESRDTRPDRAVAERSEGLLEGV